MSTFLKHRLAVVALAVFCAAEAGVPGTGFVPDLPFRDLSTGERFLGRGRVLKEDPPVPPPPALLTGCLLPATLHWQLLPRAGAQLLSYRQGGAVVRLDVTGKDAREITFLGPVSDCAIEALEPMTLVGESWRSCFQRLRVDVRGVFPWAGAPPAVDGHGSAPFQQAFDVARISKAQCLGPNRQELFVTDPAAHVVRRITTGGAVTTFAGEPAKPGHIDSPDSVQRFGLCLSCSEAAATRFNRPTYLTRRRLRGLLHDPEILVSDSGNHLIRRISLDGVVSTFAGTASMAGHHDAASPREALFNDPQGIAADAAGNVFVADRGNRVIRAIDASGAVTTLAGSPGLSGNEDGIGSSARFTNLKGLAFQPSGASGGTLYVLDGHAVRAVSWPGGLVVTIIGQVCTPGFEDTIQPGSLYLRKPCLNDPVGIRCFGGILHIADTGNHSIRRADPARATLYTMVGDPRVSANRWGLLRDAVPGPLGAGYAALESPTALAPGLDGPGCWVACAGTGLAEIHDRSDLRDRPSVMEVECLPARLGVPGVVRFRVQTLDGAGRSTSRACHCTVSFLNQDGTTAETVVQECARSFEPVAVQGAFSKAGEGTVVIRCLTDQGVSAGAARTVQVGD